MPCAVLTCTHSALLCWPGHASSKLLMAAVWRLQSLKSLGVVTNAFKPLRVLHSNLANNPDVAVVVQDVVADDVADVVFVDVSVEVLVEVTVVEGLVRSQLRKLTSSDRYASTMSVSRLAADWHWVWSIIRPDTQTMSPTWSTSLPLCGPVYSPIIWFSAETVLLVHVRNELASQVVSSGLPFSYGHRFIILLIIRAWAPQSLPCLTPTTILFVWPANTGWHTTCPRWALVAVVVADMLSELVAVLVGEVDVLGDDVGVDVTLLLTVVERVVVPVVVSVVLVRVGVVVPEVVMEDVAELDTEAVLVLVTELVIDVVTLAVRVDEAVLDTDEVMVVVTVVILQLENAPEWCKLSTELNATIARLQWFSTTRPLPRKHSNEFSSVASPVTSTTRKFIAFATFAHSFSCC